ncbi:MAG TPA: hypothetical protein VMF06_03555 [Candidatus Limnocylindria bacterium]|jgi:hypothetical protein|nr:hypothetical protein [Candidatus Limnocylindria bacterium]
MEIRPNNNLGGVNQVSAASAKPRVQAPPVEVANFSGSSALSASLNALPEARPEVVQTGKDLVSQSSYPPPVVIKRISHLIAAHVSEQTES